ncbi:NAD(P)H-quinone oxidoreductase subunit L [Picosynechococcus sp. PCC 11901]|uniref:NAD(P)H-quinone oxidoreductase subunit L n=1 Tax=unclassified Picosynechococcus TaxID=3079910 RepID=UPI0004AAEA8F|nr:MULTISPECIES: NAD(P)H-quinone oxidoreductase subunit L [unclassified Picosynechococcus]QCS49180.1 NAD(P)H-quinone oxidoreductase subunit L [Picosynechococcus sp. PCC 11901]
MPFDIPVETLLVATLYLSLSVTYLLVLPAGLYFYLNNRWYVASSIERLVMYFFVFFLFPGMLLLSPFLNFRPRRREV